MSEVNQAFLFGCLCGAAVTSLLIAVFTAILQKRGK